MECFPGDFASARNQTSCASCSTGFYSKEAGQSFCNFCDAGKFSNRNSSSSCISCPAGLYQSLNEKSFCSLCPPGSAPNAAVDAVTCLPCPDGTYLLTPAVGSAECLSCPKNSQSRSDLQGCDCKPTYYLDYDSDGLQICPACPTGADCANPGTKKTSVLPLAGYFPDVSNTNNTFVSCLNSACDASHGNGFCAVGYSGNLCTKCAPGLGRSGVYDCVPCPDPSTNRVRIFAFAILMLSFTSFLVYSAVTQSRKEIQSVLIRIVTNAIQYNALAASANVEWPQSAQVIIKAQQTMSELASSFISLDCFLSTGDQNGVSPFYIQASLMALLPIFVLGLPWLILVPKYYWERRSILKNELINDEFDRSLQIAAAGRMMFRQYLTSIIVLLFLLQPSLTATTMFLFACKQIGPSSADFYLLADLGEQCYTTRYYQFAVGIGMPCLFLYCAGIPAFFYYILHYFQPVKEIASLEVGGKSDNEKVVIPRKEIRVVTNFLQAGYRPKFFYWEIVVMVRKTLLIVVMVYFNSYPILQLLMGTLVTVVALLSHLKTFPFSAKTMNRFEFFSILTSFVVFYFGQFIVAKDISADNKVYFGTFILLWFIFFFLASFMFLGLVLFRNRRRRLAEETRKALGKVVFEEDDDEDEDVEDDVDEGDDLRHDELKKSMILNLQAEDNINEQVRSGNVNSMSFDGVLEADGVHEDALSLFDSSEVPNGGLRLILSIDGVDMHVLKEDQNMNDFIEKVGDDLCSTLGYSFERFTLHNVLPETSSSDRVMIGVDINPAPSSVSAETIFHDLEDFIALPAEEKNPEVFLVIIFKYIIVDVNCFRI